MKAARLIKSLAFSMLCATAPCLAEEPMGDKPVPARYRSTERGNRPPIDRFTYLQKRLQQFKEGEDKNLPQYLHVMCALAELELSKGAD